VRTTAVIAVAVAGCSYHAGTYADYRGGFPGTRFTTPCLDLAIGPARDPQARGPVVSYAFGNRCDHRVTLDLASVRAIARELDGRQRPLVAYDPRGEIEVATLGALGFGREQIEYVDPVGAAAEWCVDIGGIDGSAPRVERWVCMGGQQP
jgi:hypothetical protein